MIQSVIFPYIFSFFTLLALVDGNKCRGNMPYIETYFLEFQSIKCKEEVKKNSKIKIFLSEVYVFTRSPYSRFAS